MKKRLLAILLAAIMVVSLLPVSAFAATPDYADSGTGTSADPYLIATKAQLEALATAVNGGDRMNHKYFKLTKDITEPFTGTIGGKKVFGGTFDGDFHSVKLNITSGVYDNSGDCYAGLFGRVDGDGATIKNVITTGEVNVVSTASGDGFVTFVGGVCARTSGTIQNCGNTAEIHAKSDGARLTIGGICGDNEGTTKNCYNSGDVYAHNSAVLKKNLAETEYITRQYIGGICGQAATGATVSNCYSVAFVGKTSEYTPAQNEEEGREVGCVCGLALGTVSNCYFANDYGPCKVALGSGNADSCTGKAYESMQTATFAATLNTNKNDNAVEWKQIADLNFNQKYPYLDYGYISVPNNESAVVSGVTVSNTSGAEIRVSTNGGSSGDVKFDVKAGTNFADVYNYTAASGDTDLTVTKNATSGNLQIVLDAENEQVTVPGANTATAEIGDGTNVYVTVNGSSTGDVTVKKAATGFEVEIVNGESKTSTVKAGSTEYTVPAKTTTKLSAASATGAAGLLSGLVILDKGEDIVVPTATPYTVKNTSTDSQTLNVIATVSESTVTGAKISVTAGGAFSVTKGTSSTEEYKAASSATLALDSVYTTDGKGNVQLGDTAANGIQMKFPGGKLPLSDGQSVYWDPYGNPEYLTLIHNPATPAGDSIELSYDNTKGNTEDAVITLDAGEAGGIGGSMSNGTVTGAAVYTAATGGATLRVAASTGSSFGFGKALLGSGSILLEAADTPIGIEGASKEYYIDVPEGKPTATVTKTVIGGTCTVTVPAKSGDVSGVVEIIKPKSGGGTYVFSRFINNSASAVTISIIPTGAAAMTLNDNTAPTNIPTGSYTAFVQHTAESNGGTNPNTTNYTFSDETLDTVLSKANALIVKGDSVVVNTKLDTDNSTTGVQNPTTNGYVLTIDGINIYTAQGNLAKLNRADTDYTIAGVTETLYSVDARERAEYYGLEQSVASQLANCLVVKVSNEAGEANGHVEVQAGEAKIKWSDSDTTYYVTLADAIYDASHAIADGTTENQYNTHDGKETAQTIEMNINPYENRTGLVLEAGDKLVIRGEENAKSGDSYEGVAYNAENEAFEPADLSFSMYAGKNDVYVVSGTAKVTNNTDSTKGEADGAADAYVGAYNAGFYARTTAANDILYVTGGTTATYTAEDAAYVTASGDAQSVAIGVGAGYVTYTGVTEGDVFPITAIGELDVDGEKVEVEESKITADYTLYSVIDKDTTAKVTATDTATTEGKTTIVNDAENNQVVITAAKAGEKVAVDPMGGSAQTEYTFAEDNTTLTVKAYTGTDESVSEYVTALTTGAVQLDKDEAIFETAADVKIVSTVEGKAITVETASVNGVTGVIVTAPEGGSFNVLDKDGVKTGLNGITVKAETKFFVDGTGYITLLNGKIEVAGNADSFINLGTNDEKITGVDGTLTVEAVRTNGGELTTFENGVTTAYVTVPAGKQASFVKADGTDSQTYTNPTKKPDGSGNDDTDTVIAVLPTTDAQRVVVGGDVELDKGEKLYVTDAAYVKATDVSVNTPVATDLTLVTNSGDTKVQVAYGNSDALNLHDPDPYNTVTVPEGGEATFTIGENARKVAVQEDGNDLVNSMLEAAVIPVNGEKEIVVSFPPLDYLYRAVYVDGNSGITYTNKDTTKATLLGITKDGTVYARKGSASTEEGDILLDPGESVNVKLNTGFAKVENTAAQDSKKVTVGKETTKNSQTVNPVTVPKGGSVKIEGVAFSTEKMSGNTVFDIVKDGGDILTAIPTGETLGIDGKDYKATAEAAIKVIPAEKHDDMTKNEIVLLSGTLEITAGQAVTNVLPVENKGTERIALTNDETDTVAIPADNTVVVGGIVIKPEANTTASITSEVISIPVPAGESVTVDGIVYTNTTEGEATLTINAVTGLPTTDSNVFDSFDVEVPNGLKGAATVTLPNGKTIDRNAQTFTVPDGKSITLGDRTYTAVDGEIVVDANASGIAVWIDPLVTVKAKVTVTENKQFSKNPDNETEKAINTYESKTDGTAAVAVFTGKRDEVTVSAGELELTASNVWHIVTFSGITAPSQIVEWGTDYDTVLTGITTTKPDAFFAGWYRDSASTRAVNKSSDKVLADATIYAKWVQKTGTVTGTVQDDSETPAAVSGASVKLMKGNVQWGDAKTTDASGTFTFENVPMGTYQIVATKTDGGKEYTTTALVVINAAGKVTVDGAETATMSLNISGNKKANSSVEITGNTPDVAVGGLDAVAKEAAKTIDPGQTVTVNMSVESQIKVATNEEQSDIQKEAEGRTVEYISIDIFKTIRTTADGTLVGQENVPVKETEGLITVVVPFQTSGRLNFIIIRSHEGEDSVKTIDKLTTTPNTDGEYIVVGAGEITMFVKKFSTYSIGYNTNGSDIGGNIGGGSTKNEVELPTDLANGKLEVSPKSAAKGSTVTLTVTPDKGYELDTLTVLDKDGKEIEVKDLGNGKFSFKMPDGKVSVSATFKKPTMKFTDVKEGSYYYDAVLWAAENGITDGTSATIFSPDMGTTRAQVVTFLWRAAGRPEPKGDTSVFTDVPANEYYTKAVAWAIEQGITKGTSTMTFDPDAVCTRAQIVTFLARFAGVKDADTASVFSDVNATDYFAAAVKWAKDNKVTEGTSATTFSPNNDCIRAQVVTFLYRWMVK